MLGWKHTVGLFSRRFTRCDRRRLEQALQGERDARRYRRLEAVLAVASGGRVAAVATRMRAERSTVHRWCERHRSDRDAQALSDRPGRGRHRVAPQLTRTALARWLRSDPRKAGVEANLWTVPMLSAHLRAQGLSISARTLRRRIREARFRWKRRRYVYHERADHVGAK